MWQLVKQMKSVLPRQSIKLELEHIILLVPLHLIKSLDFLESIPAQFI